ncbi:hypothetical protein PS619_02533 [Pseudomonas fluorescens]|jgi:hypothetical protein|nr:hypothetical protein PS619_02533 [Pseudomonas fluorescens]
MLLSKLELGSIYQVGVTRQNNSVSSLSLWERARVRATPTGPRQH